MPIAFTIARHLVLDLRQARDVVRAAEENPQGFDIPTVVFLFACGISTAVAAALEEIGIVVEGERFDLPVDDESSSESGGGEGESVTATEPLLPAALANGERDGDGKAAAVPLLPGGGDMPEISTVNLDVSFLVAYCSDVCNGGESATFDDVVLERQAYVDPLESENGVVGFGCTFAFC